ncbi:LemA family protein [Nostoc sp. XA010]|uniref:LemA family protein n=1 Tax=Nostoc sp. XA010 TaxID=2780407 RepID=UPI0027DEC9B8|nr:LemA family protein [Nostoc sp. XA010]
MCVINFTDDEANLLQVDSSLLVLSESYPELKADRAMTQVMEELSSTENRIAFARQAFNDAVTLYNTKSESFPSNLVANTFNFTVAELLPEATPEIRNAPRVSF